MKEKVAHLTTRLAAACCLLLGLWCLPAHAQQITVKGNVIDDSGLPVIGAGVTLKGTTTGVAADVDGSFVLNVPGENSVLEIAALGYVTQEVKIGKQRTLTIVLQEDAQSLEATVVVA